MQLELGKDLRASIIEEGSCISFVVDGCISRTSQFQLFINSSTNFKKVIFDLKNLDSVNSEGLRDWIIMLDSLKKNVGIEYHHVPHWFLMHMSSVAGLVSNNCKVVNFEALFIDPKTGKELSRYFEVDSLVNDRLPLVKDPETGNLLTFDGSESKFLFFLKQQTK